MRRKACESIEMRQRRHGYFPAEFRWRGHIWRVAQVEHCWTESRQDWRRTVQRHCFQVRCDNGKRLELFQDVQGNTWHVLAQAGR